MAKFNFGAIKTDDGRQEEVLVSTKLFNKPKNIIIGLGLMLAGAGYLMTTAFKEGAIGYFWAEEKVLRDLDVLDTDRHAGNYANTFNDKPTLVTSED